MCLSVFATAPLTGIVLLVLELASLELDSLESELVGAVEAHVVEQSELLGAVEVHDVEQSSFWSPP